MPFDYLVLATGARPRLPQVPGVAHQGIFTLRNVANAIRLKRYLIEHNATRALVIGAGLIALEMCEAFRSLGLETTLVYRKDLPMRRLGTDFGEKIRQELERNNVYFLPHTEILGFDKVGKHQIVTHTNNGELPSDLVLVGMGVLPEVELAAAAGIKIGPTGAIAVDQHLQTNISRIYAAGDCCECLHLVSRQPVHMPLGDIANKQGRIAGAHIGGQEVSFPGIVGSICCKVFDLEIASTGLSEEEAKRIGLQASSVIIQGFSKAHSFPGATRLWLRLVAEPSSGRLLGAQAIGGNGVVARINILAAALTAGLELEQLAYMDLAYAPPFSGAWDPIHIAAQQLLK